MSAARACAWLSGPSGVPANGGSLPCNLKFLIEGEEEIGSENLSRFLRRYAKLIAFVERSRTS
jgi:acetylornithine deacetylase/succinyl-diaminopimelate desuccinylase-like protein